ncbi:ester cyclase [Kordiimonas sp. SCSIO 12610]|uniref:ester cyclase n=1 Tax=Kordiimonas sp. SCSIO 12610 TaxID=2829597 RepID=UPI002108CB3C|nr:ester cyclase [Kordiimonas sp. SCSIO 12610]UTW55611.1 ester cyclase [Kordiimonas sp. SCSIO 12610]
MTTEQLRKFMENFIFDIRAGNNLDRVSDYMAEEVFAHQIMAEGGETVKRSPANYREHIEEFQKFFGPFEITIEDMLVDSDKVLVRWCQKGCHNISLEGEEPTKRPLTEVTSTIYRIQDGKIVEYWLQTDRAGMSNQLKAFNADTLT